MYAKLASQFIALYTLSVYDDPKMESMVAPTVIECFNIKDSGTHKYIPAKRLSEDLGMKESEGVYGYWKFSDGSYLLKTCPGRLAYWSGSEWDMAQWSEPAPSLKIDG